MKERPGRKGRKKGGEKTDRRWRMGGGEGVP